MQSRRRSLAETTTSSKSCWPTRCSNSHWRFLVNTVGSKLRSLRLMPRNQRNRRLSSSCSQKARSLRTRERAMSSAALRTRSGGMDCLGVHLVALPRQALQAWSARTLAVRSGWSGRTRPSRSTKASIVTWCSCRPRMEATELIGVPLSYATVLQQHYATGFLPSPLEGPPVERWRHNEERPSDGSAPTDFEFYWVSFDEIPHLAVGQGRHVQELRQRIGVHSQRCSGVARGRWEYIEPGSPWENGHIECFNGKLRDKLLDRELFHTLRRRRC